MKSVSVKILKWLPAAVICGISWYLSCQEKIEAMPDFWNADKLVHLVCFSGFSFWVAFACNVKEFKIKKLWLPVSIVSFYGIIDEIHQSFTPGRSSSVFDWMADTIGAVLGVIVFCAVCRLIYSQRSKK